MSFADRLFSTLTNKPKLSSRHKSNNTYFADKMLTEATSSWIYLSLKRLKSRQI